MRAFSITLLILLPVSVWCQDDAKAIFTKATEQLQVYNIEMSLDVRTVDNNGRVKEKGFDVLIAKFGDLEKTRMRMQRPERAAGVTIVMTSLPDEIGTIEVYTPANGKIRKMKATDENMALVGSDISFSRFASREIDDAQYTLIGTEELDGKLCMKIEARETKGEEGGWAEFLIEKSTLNILQLSVFDENGKQQSITTLSEFKAISGMKGKMQPTRIHTQQLSEHKTSEIDILEITPKMDTNEDDFDIEKLSN